MGRDSMSEYRFWAHRALILFTTYLMLSCLNEGCGSGNGTSPEAQLGAIHVDAEPDSVRIEWLLTGPSSFVFYGLGDDTLSGLAAGAYTMTWPDVLGRVTPSPNPQSLLLEPGGVTRFTGLYAGIGELHVDVDPDFIVAIWRLECPGGLVQDGTGDHLFADMPEGDYLLRWGDQAGYRTPVPSQSARHLGAGAALTYHGQYVPVGTLSIDPEPDELSASWRVLGPAGLQAESAGDTILTDLDAGCYIVEFLHESGWLDPSPNPIVSCLVAGSSQVAQGVYSRAASLFLEPEPYGIRAPWTVSGPNGFSRAGNGSSAMRDIAPGTYTVVWHPYGGWQDPSPDTQLVSLTAGESAVSSWRYDWAAFRSLPANTFSMGSPPEEPGRLADEQLHPVTLTKSFAISPVEVTQDQWLLFMTSNPSPVDCGDCPVSGISWFEAVRFCNAVSSAFGLTPPYQINGASVTWNQSANGYRLPTEAEWEYACRSGTSTPQSSAGMWYVMNSGGRARSVGELACNAWGLYDMHGNANEWCWDWFGAYQLPAATDPIGSVSGTERVYRGGYWALASPDCRSARRLRSSPTERPAGAGLRLVRTVN